MCNNNKLTSCPDRKRLIRVNIESSNLIPTSAVQTDVRSHMWTGRGTSIHLLLLPANDFIALTTSEEVAGACRQEEGTE